MKVDYSKCKIYKLVDMINNYFYIGSTCDSLSKRLCNHRAMAKIKTEQKVYKYFNDIGFKNVKIILIIAFPECKNKDEKLRKEQEYIDLHWNDEKCLISKNSFLSEEQKNKYNKNYYENNKNKLQLKIKEYKENNKDKIKEYNKEYYENNKYKKENTIKNIIR